MSRITRRTFLRTCTALASATSLAACTWANPSLPSGLGQAQLTIWSIPGSIDQALARWRRIHPTVNVRRRVFAAPQLAEQIAQLPTRTSEIPDVIVADSYTINAYLNAGIWRQIDRTTQRAELQSAAIGHVFIDERRIVGLPLTCNPLKIWYHADILADALGLRDETQVQRAIGTNTTSFIDFLRQLHRTNPQITTMASCFDDFCYPLAVDAMQQQRTLDEGLALGVTLAQQHVIGRSVHFGGEWFDQLKRNSIGLMVGGRWLGSAISRTWNSENRSPWRTIPHAVGDIYGPSIVAAIPIQAARYEQATQLIDDLAFDVELQILISNESKSIPAATSAYAHPDLNQVDAILPERTIREAWSARVEGQVPLIDAQRVTQIQRSKDAFYAWQQGVIDDDGLRILLSESSIKDI
jgi:hypothetical protein